MTGPTRGGAASLEVALARFRGLPAPDAPHAEDRAQRCRCTGRMRDEPFADGGPHGCNARVAAWGEDHGLVACRARTLRIGVRTERSADAMSFTAARTPLDRGQRAVA